MGQRKDKQNFSQEKRRFSPFELLKSINYQSKSMRGKLMLYLCSLVLAGTGVLLLMMTAAGVFSESGRRLEQTLQLQLENQKKDLKDRMELFAGSGIDLSKRLISSLERDVLTYPYDIKELENNEEGLQKMQENMYLLLESKLHVTRASGVFAVVDTTVNTKAPAAERSRSGLYLRMANVSGSALENDIFLFRGNPNIAMQNRIQIHNRWNMEFNIENMDWYKAQLFNKEQKATTENYLWIDRHSLDGTWENSIFLSVPMIGTEGAHYGVCGLEISHLLFHLTYPKFESKYGDMVTIMAPVEGNKLLVSKGLTGSQGSGYINEDGDLDFDIGRGYNFYRNGKERYIGVQQPIEGAQDVLGRQWAVAVLVSYSSFYTQARCERMILIAILLIFIFIMFLSSYIISRQFVKPIEQGIENLKTENLSMQQVSTGIKEIDVLAEFLKQKEERYMSAESTQPKLPPNIEELFNRFIEHSKELTISERNILGYYVEGYETSEVPELACISLNTVRKHNRSIYKKLDVNSKDELQLYLDLLIRCGRIDELL